MTNDEPIYSYSNDAAIADGVFADVTPGSVKREGKWRWIVTAAIHAEFSLAAIAEMYNEMIVEIQKRKRIEFDKTPYLSTKMNGKEVWLFLEPDVPFPNNQPRLIFKVIFPSDY